jgi:acetyl esterase/lipase
MPWVLFAVGASFVLMTVPALVTVTNWAFLLPSFFLSWLGTGMAGWWIAIMSGLTVVVVALGGLAAWPGWIGLALVVGSIAVLVRKAFVARNAAAEFDRVLAERVAHRARTHRRPRSMVLPWWMRDVDVERVKNLRYAEGAGRRHLLDVYRPSAGSERAPVLLQIHGGGWTVGTKDTQGRPLMNELARAGWVCVAANYRLSPRVKWPDHLVDTKLALAWIREHIAEYGGDPDHVVVTGGSAGGHLAAMVALTQNDPAYQPGFAHVDTSVVAAIPMYGAYDLVEIFGRFGTGLGSRVAGWVGSLVLGVTPRQDLAPYADASPIHHVTPGSSPLLSHSLDGGIPAAALRDARHSTPSPSHSLDGGIPAAALRDARHSTPSPSHSPPSHPPPFLVVHGTSDNLVPVSQARRFVAALRDVGADVTYVELAGAPHAFDVFHSSWEHASTTGIEWWLSSVMPASARTPVEAAAAAGSGTPEDAPREASDPTTTARTAPSSGRPAPAAARRS